MNGNTIPKNALILGYSGVIPFAATAILVALGNTELRQMALDAFLVYGAVILSFLGGIRWGAATSDGTSTVSAHGLLASVLPSLWAAFFLWWPSDHITVWGLMVGFILMGLADWLYPGLKVAIWMRPLRVRLTLAVVACHLVVIGLLSRINVG